MTRHPMHEDLTPDLRLVRAPNPSAMTERGTNTWIVGRGAVAVIDPGPDDEGHLEAILAALDPTERVSHILVTHPHADHIGGVDDLRSYNYLQRQDLPVYGNDWTVSELRSRFPYIFAASSTSDEGGGAA